MAPSIHPTAIVGPNVRLADDVTVGPFAILDGAITLGPGCVVRGHAQIVGTVTAGAGNDFGAGCVIGDRPQHLAYRGEESCVVIGDGNTFREHVTVHRAMPTGSRETRIGDRNLFMASSHAGHDAVVGNDCIFVNSSCLAGHAVVGNNVLISAFSGVHQFTTVGRLAFLTGLSASSQDVPPFWKIREMNRVVGINAIGMRRAGIPLPEISAVRKAFRFIYFDKLPVSAAVLKMEAQLGDVPAVREVIEFIRASKRGIAGPGAFRADRGEMEAA